MSIAFNWNSKGVQKERMAAEDMFVLSSDGCILSRPPLKIYSQIPSADPKITECSTLFLKVYLYSISIFIFLFSFEQILDLLVNKLLL